MAEKATYYKMDYSPEMKKVRSAINKLNKDCTTAGKITGTWNSKTTNVKFAKAANEMLLRDLIELGYLIDNLLYPLEGKPKAVVGFTNPKTKEKTAL